MLVEAFLYMFAFPSTHYWYYNVIGNNFVDLSKKELPFPCPITYHVNWFRMQLLTCGVGYGISSKFIMVLGVQIWLQTHGTNKNILMYVLETGHSIIVQIWMSKTICLDRLRVENVVKTNSHFIESWALKVAWPLSHSASYHKLHYHSCQDEAVV